MPNRNSLPECALTKQVLSKQYFLSEISWQSRKVKIKKSAEKKINNKKKKNYKVSLFSFKNIISTRRILTRFSQK